VTISENVLVSLLSLVPTALAYRVWGKEALKSRKRIGILIRTRIEYRGCEIMASNDKTIKVYYDFACPFCYIGNKSAQRLEKEFGVGFEWIGWEIGPNIKKHGEIREDRERSFIIKSLAYDQDLTFAVPPVRANTRLALEGSEYANDHGKFKDYFNRVMEEYWIKGINISTLQSLKEIAQTVGLNTEEFSQALRDRIYKEKILGDDAAEKLDIRYVPTFVFGGFRIVGNIPFYVLREAVKVYMLGYEPKI